MVGQCGKDLSQVHEAIKTKDFPRLGEIIEANGLRMHGTTLGAVPPFTYWSPGSLQAMALVRQARLKEFLVTLQWMQVRMSRS